MVNFNELHQRATRDKMTSATNHLTKMVKAAYPWLRAELGLGVEDFGAVRLTSTRDIDRWEYEHSGKALTEMTLFGGAFVPQNEQLEQGFVVYTGNGERMDYYYNEVVQTIHTESDDMRHPFVENPDGSTYIGTGYNTQTQELYGLYGMADGVMPVSLFDYPQDLYLPRIDASANTIARATKFLGSIAAQHARPTMEVVTQVPAEYRA